jgi:hypothetical protein
MPKKKRFYFIRHTIQCIVEATTQKEAKELFNERVAPDPVPETLQTFTLIYSQDDDALMRAPNLRRLLPIGRLDGISVSAIIKDKRKAKS